MGGEREARLLEMVQSSMQEAVDAGVIRVRITDDQLTGTKIRVNGTDFDSLARIQGQLHFALGRCEDLDVWRNIR